MDEDKIKDMLKTWATEVKLTVQYLLTLAIGEIATYEKLTEISGRDSRHEGRNIVRIAITRVLKEKGIVFAVVVNEGYKRLSDAEAIDYGESFRGSIRRKIKRQHAVVTSVAYDKLSETDKVRHNVIGSTAMMLLHCLKPKTIAKIEDTVKLANDMLPVMKTLEAFKNVKPEAKKEE